MFFLRFHLQVWILLLIGFNSWVFQHEVGHAAYLNAQKQMDEIQTTIATKTSTIKEMKTELKKNELESSKAHKEEQVSDLGINIFYYFSAYELID